MAKIISPTNPLLPEIFALHGKWRSEKQAVIAPGETLTWQALNSRMNQVANGLLEMGLEKGDCVIVLMSNGAAMAESLFGIMAAGLVSAPLNLSVNDDAIKNMILDSGAKAIIVTDDQAGRLETLSDSLPELTWANRISTGPQRAGWMQYSAWRDRQSQQRPDVQIDPDDYLNIIYSSGTTGQPKGIVHTHQGRRDWAYDLAIALRYNSSARFCATIGLYSNISWVGMLCALLAGGTLIINRKFDAKDLWKQIARDRITHLSMVPLQFERLLEVRGHENYDASSMQGMMSAGSPLRDNVKLGLLERFSCGVIELYGLTEGVITTLDPEEARSHLSSVGRPLIGTDIKILDDEDEECAAGESGEIISCGRIVMPEYLNRPEASKEALWVDSSGKHWLRTGDIGYLDGDGLLYIVDRKKDMILSGGQNIYPQDIEAVLIKHPNVKDAAVIGVPSRKWAETPLAIIVPENGTADPRAILEAVNQQLGRQQRIAGVEIVSEIPRNPNGKILKTVLRGNFKDRIFD